MRLSYSTLEIPQKGGQIVIIARRRFYWDDVFPSGRLLPIIPSHHIMICILQYLQRLPPQHLWFAQRMRTSAVILKLVLSSPYFTWLNRIVGVTHWNTCAVLLTQNKTVRFSLLVIRRASSAIAMKTLDMTTTVYQFRDIGAWSGIACGTVQGPLNNRTWLRIIEITWQVVINGK